MEDKRLTGWTEERVVRLKELWAMGLSASQVAADLGNLTRNAVIGKLDRLGLSGQRRDKKRATMLAKPCERRASEHPAKVQRIVAARVLAEVSVKPEPFVVRSADTQSRMVPLLDLGPYGLECRWADEERNEDGLHTFCGNLSNGGSYCSAHAAISRGPGTASERAAVSALRRVAA